MPCGKSNSGVGYAQLAGRNGSLPSCVENYEALETSKNISVSSGWSSFSLSETTPTHPSLSTRSSSRSHAHHLPLPLSLWTIFKYQLWQLIDAFCNYFWRWLRAEIEKLSVALTTRVASKKYFCKMCEKTPHIRMNIYTCIGVCVCNLWT